MTEMTRNGGGGDAGGYGSMLVKRYNPNPSVPVNNNVPVTINANGQPYTTVQRPREYYDNFYAMGAAPDAGSGVPTVKNRAFTTSSNPGVEAGPYSQVRGPRPQPPGPPDNGVRPGRMPPMNAVQYQRSQGAPGPGGRFGLGGTPMNWGPVAAGYGQQPPQGQFGQVNRSMGGGNLSAFSGPQSAPPPMSQTLQDKQKQMAETQIPGQGPPPGLGGSTGTPAYPVPQNYR